MILTNKKRIQLTELLQDNFTDLDIYREKPMTFKNGEIILVIKPVGFIEHDKLLKDMAQLLIRYFEIFNTVDELTAYNYKANEAIKILINKMAIYTATKKYSKFKKDASKFICKWAFISKEKKVIELKHDKRLCKKFLKIIEPSEFIYILFLIFVFNFDIVKKNTIEFLKMFQSEGVMNSKQDIQLTGSKDKVVQMPKYSEKPFSKSILKLLEEQSRMN
jgi:hypothetical protein